MPTFGVAWIDVIKLAYCRALHQIQNTADCVIMAHLAIPVVVSQELLSSFLIQCAFRVRVDQKTFDGLPRSYQPETNDPTAGGCS